MDTSILVAIITASGGIIVAALTFYLTKRHQLKVEWQKEKLNHYKVLLSAISGIVGNKPDFEAGRNFALAFNTISLVAPQYVIKALLDFQYATRSSNPNLPIEEHDRLLKELLLSIRKDIGLSITDDPDTFYFHLISWP